MRHTRTEVQKASSDRPPGTPGNVLRPAGRQSKTNKMGVPGASRPTEPPREIRKGPSGNPIRDSTRRSNVECGGVLLSHTLSSAVPSPRPGLSFRVRKGTGRLTWAMTTAKPVQRPTHQGIGRQTEPCHDSDRGGPGTGQRTRATKRFTGIVSVTTRKQCSLPSNERNHHRTRPDPASGSEKVCRVRPLVPVGSTPRGASTSGLSNTCSTCGLQTPKCQGILILEQASRLDAFSGYPSRT